MASKSRSLERYYYRPLTEVYNDIEHYQYLSIHSMINKYIKSRKIKDNDILVDTTHKRVELTVLSPKGQIVTFNLTY